MNRIFQIERIECDSCGKLLRTKRVEIKSFALEDAHIEIGDHLCKACDEIFSADLKKHNKD